MLRVGTLCSGIGAPEFALKLLGIDYKLVFACDIDPVVKETYLLNHTCEIFYDDIYAITNPPPVDLMVVGFPCQSFSLAGKGLGLNDPRGKVVLRAFDVIAMCKPRYVIMENVEGLITRDNGKTLKILIRRLNKMGYAVTYKVLNALDYGVAQHRKRVWIVATNTGKPFEFPAPTMPVPSLADFLSRRAPAFVFATDSFASKPKVAARISRYNKDYVPCITKAIARNGSSSEYIGQVGSVYNCLGQMRKPTVDECRKLFGIPDDFIFPAHLSTTRRYEMLANSMVVPVLESIIKEIVD